MKRGCGLLLKLHKLTKERTVVYNKTPKHEATNFELQLTVTENVQSGTLQSPSVVRHKIANNLRKVHLIPNSTEAANAFSLVLFENN